MGGQVGQRIREARKGAHIKREEMAVALGVSVATVDRIETGRSDVTTERLCRIASMTGKPIGFFLRDAA